MKSQLTARDVEIVETTTPYKGYFRIDRYLLRHRLFQGGWSSTMMREVFERGHAATALLYDPDLDAVVLIEQFRIGAYVTTSTLWHGKDFSPWLIECVAGIIEEGETPEDVIRREAVEEADCRITDILPIHRYMVSPGGTTETVMLFCARVDASKAGGVHGLTAEHENIRVLVVPVAEAIAWLDQGKFVNAMAIIAMQWMKLNHARVREQWLRTEKKV
ncbi:MAG: NUDIX domain-containing protein [Rhodospirillales bacterium]|nr:NUDIX domain-containing protein [Rhodospirillales bacterium]